MPLRETLNRLRERSPKDHRDRKAVVAEWQSEVSALLARIREYLSEYEQDGSLTFKERHIRLTEETLGTYNIGGMDIEAGPILIVVRPVGRLVTDAEGRVDMHRQGRPGEEHRIMLLRMPSDGVNRTPPWLITLPQIASSRQTQVYTGPRPSRRLEPLSKPVLEEAVDLLLH
jgi:hypothetical protein